MNEDIPLPSKDKLLSACSESKTVITITCPHCNYIWTVEDIHDDDCSKMDVVDVIEQCPKCDKWMKIYDDEVAVDMFYESREGWADD